LPYCIDFSVIKVSLQAASHVCSPSSTKVVTLTQNNWILFKMNTQDVHAVAIKLPTFWTSQPSIWFIQAEAQFNIRKVTEDSTKYYYVVSALDQTTASRIMDVLQHPPDEGLYDNLKKRLLETFGQTRRDRASKLLHLNGLGDRKPSELMDEILSLLDGHKPCLLAEQVFLEQLPEDIRVQIADSDFSDPRKVALHADVLWLAKQQSAAHTINRVKVKKQETGAKTSHRFDWCFYHNKFGDRAQRCRSPCKHPGNETAGRLQH
jgi:hypothetical protein